MKTITSVQKVIKVGSSLAVTIPAKDAQFLGIKAGDTVLSSVDPQTEVKDVKAQEIEQNYADFKKVYGSTLKNLASR